MGFEVVEKVGKWGVDLLVNLICIAWAFCR